MGDRPGSSRSVGRLRSARRLLQRKQRLATGLFLAEGPQAVREALSEPGRVRELFHVADNERIEPLLATARSAGVRAYQVTAAELARITETQHPQGIVAVCEAREGSLDELSAEAKLVVVCAQVRDPGNAGTVIRCADAFGADAVVLTADSVEVTNPKVVRASVGSVFHLPVITGAHLANTLDFFRDKGFQVLAADGGGADSLDELAARGELDRPTVWLMGNEAWGLPPEHAVLADRQVSVPIFGRAESLNLATAAAVCLYATATAQRS
ncbi:TrmH family RNA methyltransferase [Enemella evansiae]|uniref:TrmH family RNA methyltransferase n=1 Tax=Enemella evansiae TaxID=2016499 RepID=UPI000B972BD5|nr:RNA methyltransferase [Enemella evansiae]OYN99700.1 rRNA methyltransferase [Enemella evansiae]OYO02894.1 rRNA methyltransferase [Enemella evansiae]OYO06599.1 rRNA methyltransferase [Enemella evansiae]OYO15706.1 rRNA methyltransferase [Enemella evansiae]